MTDNDPRYARAIFVSRFHPAPSNAKLWGKDMKCDVCGRTTNAMLGYASNDHMVSRIWVCWTCDGVWNGVARSMLED